MKRSQAIQIISNFIYELNVDSEDCDFESDRILTALEKAGLLPPHVAEACSTHLVVPDWGENQYLQTEDSSVFVSKWENEDETK